MTKQLERRTEKARPKGEMSDEGVIARALNWPLTRRHIDPTAEGHKVAQEGVQIFRKALRSKLTENA